MPSVATWLQGAVQDAERHGHADVRPVLEGLAVLVGALRAARWNADAVQHGSAAPQAPPPGHRDDQA